MIQHILTSDFETVVINIFVDVEFSILVECLCGCVAFWDCGCSIDRNQMGGSKNVIKGDNARLQGVALANNP